MDFTMFKSAVACLLFSLCLISPIESQIPAFQEGFRYGPNPASVDSVLIEAFFDPVCPYSRDSWPPLKDALKQYGSRVSLVVHTFPLPYHDNAFSTSKALHIANTLNSSSTYHVLEAFFHHQELFYGKATVNKSKAAIREEIVDFTARAHGPSFRSEIKSLYYNDTKSEQATRAAFKYGAIRGVYGTPSFFVNGFPLTDADSLNVTGWRNVIDPLVSQHSN